MMGVTTVDVTTIDVTTIGDEELLSLIVDSGSVFKESYAIIVPVLREIKLRFLIARKERKPYLGYTSFNRLCDEKLIVSHRAVRKLVSDVKLQNHPKNIPWYVREFGEGCEEKHRKIGAPLLDTLYKNFKDFEFGGWAPWKPKSESDVANWTSVEDRYKVTLFLTAEEIKRLSI